MTVCCGGRRRYAALRASRRPESGQVRDALGDVVVRDARVTAEEVALVLGVQHRGLDVLARERTDCRDAVPQREGDELGRAVVVAAEQPRAAIARRSTVLGEA